MAFPILFSIIRSAILNGDIVLPICYESIFAIPLMNFKGPISTSILQDGKEEREKRRSAHRYYYLR
jgi:hypothetical protein